jgi:hypothetical protein
MCGAVGLLLLYTCMPRAVTSLSLPSLDRKSMNAVTRRTCRCENARDILRCRWEDNIEIGVSEMECEPTVKWKYCDIGNRM